MLTLAECQEAIHLERQKEAIIDRLEALSLIEDVTVTGPLVVAYRYRRGGDGAGLSQGTLDGIRHLLIAEDKEHLATVEARLSQLIVKVHPA